jgi:hypothetical protein
MAVGALSTLRTPRGVVTALVLLVLAVLPLLTQAFDQRYLLSVGNRIVIWAIAAASLNMILGYAGLVSFGHAASLGIGGYAVGILSAEGFDSGWLQWPVAIFVAIAWAALIGALSLRTRGVYFIMITLAFAQLVYYLSSGLAAYGGDDGLNISRSRFPGLIDLRDKAAFYWLSFALLCATLWFCSRLAHSRFGYVLRGARSNELRMAALGFPRLPLSPRCLRHCRRLRRAGGHPDRQRRRLYLSRHDVVGEIGRPHRDRRAWRHRRTVRPALRRHRFLRRRGVPAAATRPPASRLGRVLADRVRAAAGGDRPLCPRRDRFASGASPWLSRCFGPRRWSSASAG